MATMSSIEYRRLRAPQQHGESLIEPPLSDLPHSAPRHEFPVYDLQGRELGQVARQARREMLQAAAIYTGQYQDVATDLDATRPIVMAGHQPNLFHAGVWLKNFVLNAVGQRWNAHRVNVLIDNDIVRSCSVRVPVSGSERATIESIAYDAPHTGGPYEERAIVSTDQMHSFADRLSSSLAPQIEQPLVRDLWPFATKAIEDGWTSLGGVIGRARHQLEMQWGSKTLEVPLSVLTDTPSFRWFASHLLAHLPRLWDVYNSSLRDYRQAHHLRSRSHPVPDLQEEADGWLEAPFWVWQEGSQQRNRVFVRVQGECLAVSDRGGINFCVPLDAERPADAAVEHLERLRDQGIKLRPRALITTMYFRLLLSDTFVHGIGGAKYDQLTNVLMHRFFGLCAPEFMVVSGTFLLPVQRPRTTETDLRFIDRQLRDLDFNPQRQLVSDHELRKKKENWIQQPSNQARHRAITRLNEQMQPLVESERQRLEGDRQRLVADLRNRNLLSSREFSFCLFPEQTLRPLLDILIDPP